MHWAMVYVIMIAIAILLLVRTIRYTGSFRPAIILGIALFGSLFGTVTVCMARSARPPMDFNSTVIYSIMGFLLWGLAQMVFLLVTRDVIRQNKRRPS